MKEIERTEHTVETDSLEEDFKKTFQRSPEDRERIRKKLNAYLDELDTSTPENPEDSIQEIERTYTKEELDDIYKNDPGYVNEKATKELPGGKEKDPDRAVLKEDGPYMRYGYHDDLSNWKKDAVEGTEKETLLKPGKLVERWGDESGSYLTEPGTEFDDLHLNVSQDKLKKTTYEVVKPFPVTESVIADQPFDESSENRKGGAAQYRSHVSISELVDKGYLKRV